MNINLQKHVPSVSISTARFWKMSMWDECAIVAIPGVCPLLCIYWIAWVPTYRTSAFISGMLYFIPGVLETCQPHILVQTHRGTTDCYLKIFSLVKEHVWWYFTGCFHSEKMTLDYSIFVQQDFLINHLQLATWTTLGYRSHSQHCIQCWDPS